MPMPGEQQRREKERQDAYQGAKDFHYKSVKSDLDKMWANTRATNAAIEKGFREKYNRDLATNGGAGSKRPAVGRGLFGGTIKTLFFLATLYGAYDSVANQSSIGESVQKAGRITYGLSDALGNKIKSIDPDSFLITIANDFRWAVGLGVSIDVGLGAGAGNAVVWMIRQAAHLIQPTQSTSSNASRNPELR
jgi:hypothetical protein